MHFSETREDFMKAQKMRILIQLVLDIISKRHKGGKGNQLWSNIYSQSSIEDDRHTCCEEMDTRKKGIWTNICRQPTDKKRRKYDGRG